MNLSFIMPSLTLVGIIFALLMILGHLLNKQKLPASQADAALVFGTGLLWKARPRWTHAAKLYHQEKVRYLIVSGGVKVPNTTQTKAEWFRDHLVKLNVPPDRVLMENQATNAAENVEFALPIIQR